MEEALIRTDKETLKKVKRMAAEKSLSVSAFIREVAEGAAPPAYSISDQLLDLDGYVTYLSKRIDAIEKSIDRLFGLVRDGHKEHKQLVFALDKVLPGLKAAYYDEAQKGKPDLTPDEIQMVEAAREARKLKPDTFETDFYPPMKPGDIPFGPPFEADGDEEN